MTATVGIDLASQPKRTAVAVIDWSTRPATVLELALGADGGGTEFHDKWLYTTAVGMRGESGWPTITKVGIDAPLGWPRQFVDALGTYSATLTWPGGPDNDRSAFYRRTTDHVVRESEHVVPLAVSVDKIGYCAIRCASLLSEIVRIRGQDAARRDGSGLVCEVYPDPALRRWTRELPNGLGHRESYKGAARIARREELWDLLLAQVPLADPRGLIAVARESSADDHLDALTCALVARACELGLTVQPSTDGETSDALLEGWIHIPTEPLAVLA